MRAVQFDQVGGPEVLKVVEVPRPTAAPGQVVVRNRWAGINFIDTYFRSGVYDSPLPGSLGQEASGEVAEVGEGVEGLKVGDAVAYLGNQDTYAQYSVTKAARVAKIDTSKMSLETAAAMLLQGLTAHTLVTRSYVVKPGDWVLVQAGAGGTGRLLVQLCRQLGARVIATTSTEEKAEVARRAGASHIINYTEESVPEAVHRIVPEGVHVVYDGVGKTTYAGSIAALRREGSMVSFGNASGTVPPVKLFDLSSKNLLLLRPRLYGYLVTDEEYQRHLGELVDLVQQGKLDIQVFKIYAMEDAAQAHMDLQARKTTGKLLLSIP
ncbi:hypothetical protein H4R20_004635 [Coemansia guatemalensis]|uniref:Probable quinone oxidoreductase n=1 Tax=Coemansia guatemalensis TaxID=2761395 RepID=A0A9W8HZI1_9FUNG|nr:hypothetical protein H4R20_004635 [Coemansia guatemalensis]